MSTPPLIVHIVHRFDFGGLENGLVNLVNLMPSTVGRHVIIALTDVTEIQQRIDRDDVWVFALGKKRGKDIGFYVRLFRLLRTLKPDIVHTRNFGTLDCQFVAWLAGVRHRIHGEHGWDSYDPEGRLPKFRVVRRLLEPLIETFVALSAELESWLIQDVGIPARKVRRICNGVDTKRFVARTRPSRDHDASVVGSVTRFSEIKDPLNTIGAFIEVHRAHPGAVRLLMIGDGSLKAAAVSVLRSAGVEASACLPGSVVDVVPYLEEMDLFVLGSLREGISNTVLEAMAAGLPVIATRVGGNIELVDDGVTGYLVPPQSPSAIAAAIARYLADSDLARRHGVAGRKRIEDHFSINAMIALYSELYTGALAR